MFNSHRGQAFFLVCRVWIHASSNTTNIIFACVQLDGYCMFCRTKVYQKRTKSQDYHPPTQARTAVPVMAPERETLKASHQCLYQPRVLHFWVSHPTFPLITPCRTVMNKRWRCKVVFALSFPSNLFYIEAKSL